jgi:hypothetical protein
MKSGTLCVCRCCHAQLLSNRGLCRSGAAAGSWRSSHASASFPLLPLTMPAMETPSMSWPHRCSFCALLSATRAGAASRGADGADCRGRPGPGAGLGFSSSSTTRSASGKASTCNDISCGRRRYLLRPALNLDVLVQAWAGEGMLRHRQACALRVGQLTQAIQTTGPGCGEHAELLMSNKEVGDRIT